MKILFIISFFIISLFSNDFVDLGNNGSLYDIKENNFQDEIDSGIVGVLDSFSKEKLNTLLENKISDSSMFISSLPKCKKNIALKEKNFVFVPEDIFNPEGKIIYKKDSKILISNPININIAFISGTSKLLSDEIVFFNKVIEGQNTGSSTLLIANKDIRKLDTKERLLSVFPSSKDMEKMFNITCYPTLVFLKGENRLKYEFKLNK